MKRPLLVIAPILASALLVSCGKTDPAGAAAGDSAKPFVVGMELA